MSHSTRRAAVIGVALLALATGIQAAVMVNSPMTDARVTRPGETYQGVIELHNTGATPETVKIYQTDYRFSSDGSNDFGTPGGLTRSNAAWIKIERSQLTVPGGARAELPYQVRVPADKGQKLSGTYWSVIMVEPVPPSSPEAPLPERTTRLRQVMRYAVQVVSQIGKTGGAGLAFASAKVEQREAGRVLAVDVTNTGERWLTPRVWVELYAAKGTPLGKLEGPTRRLYPETSARFEVPLGATPPGKYVALVVADAGGDNLYGANLELEIR